MLALVVMPDISLGLVVSGVAVAPSSAALEEAVDDEEAAKVDESS